MTGPALPSIEAVGTNPTLVWGLTALERLRRIAAAKGLGFERGQGSLLVNLDFVFDPVWIAWIAERPLHAVTRGGTPVLAHCGEGDAAELRRAMAEGGPLPQMQGWTIVAQEEFGDLHNEQLRKRGQPFLEKLTEDSVRAIERISYQASYKGVTDLLTKYLWPEWAFWLTRWAARFRIAPNTITLIGGILCTLAGVAFAFGLYWPGIAAALIFMVLDTVDGKLARCTIRSSTLGDVLDHGIDHVHPPIWWWAWGVGLAAWGRPLPSDLYMATLLMTVGGYFLLRLMEGLFIAFFRIQSHVWQEVDSRFRLISARRNPNMVILFAGLLLGYPDLGLVAVGIWTMISSGFHFVRILQAWRARVVGGRLTSWLEQE